MQGTTQLFLALKECYVITKVILSNVGDSVASKVMLMHYWTVRYNIYHVVQEKKSVSYGLESTVYGIRMSWEDGSERYV